MRDATHTPSAVNDTFRSHARGAAEATRTRDEILVDEAVVESFPASDAPSWTATTHVGNPMAGRPSIDTPHQLRAHLRSDVEALALEIGERNDQTRIGRARLRAAADFVSRRLLDAGRAVNRIPVPVEPEVENLEAIIPGVQKGGEIVIGAHYDSVVGSPGADDDASGIAVLLGLACVLEGRRFARTVRLVAFTNEEPPHTRRVTMGSRWYAKRLRSQNVALHGMLSLDSVGFFGASEAPFPLRLVPQLREPFVSFVTSLRSRELALEARDAFRQGTTLKARAIALPGFLPLVSSSDHRSFWREGYPALMVTDGGPLRNRRYHTKKDVPGVLDYDSMADLVFGLASVVARLAGGAGTH